MAKEIRITEKHKLFIKEYLKNGNKLGEAYQSVYGTKSVTDASKHGNKLMQLPHVADLIEKERKKIEDRYEISRGMIIRELLELVEQCKNDEDRQHLIKSLDMMNRMAGHYVEKKEINVKGEGIVFNFVSPTKPEEPKDGD
jgi:phage terminase small subunit